MSHVIANITYGNAQIKRLSDKQLKKVIQMVTDDFTSRYKDDSTQKLLIVNNIQPVIAKILDSSGTAKLTGVYTLSYTTNSAKISYFNGMEYFGKLHRFK